MARSQLQRQVLNLYKSCLVAAKGKPGFEKTIREEFRRNAIVPRTEIIRIEYLLRNGRKKLEMIQDPHITGMGHFIENK